MKDKEILNKMLVGTYSTSVRLNLQALGSLINIDLPWNSKLIKVDNIEFPDLDIRNMRPIYVN